MRYLFPKFFILIFLVSGFFLHAQIDPAVMATITNLPPEQKQQLMKQYGSGGGNLPQSAPTAQMPNRSVKVEQPKNESFDGRSDFLGDLNSMERLISTDVSRLQTQLNQEDSSEDNELIEALEESKALLRKIKALQRREIEKRAEEFGKSETDAIKPFGYDLFACLLYTSPSPRDS